MQKRRKGRAQQQVCGNGSTGVGRAATSWSLVWRGDKKVEDGKATVVRPASIARHNLSPPSPILPTNDVLVAPCLATTSVGRVFSFTSAALQETLFLQSTRCFLLRLHSPSFLPRAHKLRDHTRSGAGAHLYPPHAYITIIPLSSSSPTPYKVDSRAAHHAAASDSAFDPLLRRLRLAVAKHPFDAHYPGHPPGPVRWC